MLLNFRTAVSSSSPGTYLRLNLEFLESVLDIDRLKTRLADIKARDEETPRNMVADIEDAIS